MPNVEGTGILLTYFLPEAFSGCQGRFHQTLVCVLITRGSSENAGPRGPPFASGSGGWAKAPECAFFNKIPTPPPPPRDGGGGHVGTTIGGYKS